MSKRRLGLSQKLLSVVLLTSTLATLVASTVQLAIEYRAELGSLHALLDGFRKTGLTSISKFAWAFDQQGLDEVINSTLAIREIAGLTVIDRDGSVIAAAQKPGMDQYQLVKADFTLVSPRGDAFGTLRVSYTRDFIVEKLQYLALSVVATNFVKSIFVSILMLAIFKRLVVNPILVMSRYFKAAAHRQPGENGVLDLRRETRLRDEFDDVVGGINDTERHLQEIFAEKAALIARQDQLVQQRTASFLVKSEQLAAVIEAVPGYLFWCDREFRLLGANESWMRQQGLTPPFAPGAKLSFFDEEIDQELRRQASELLDQNREHVQYETLIESGSEKRRLLVCLSRLTRVNGLMVVVIDTTRNWLLEQEANAHKQIAMNSARLSSLGEMAGGIAHEIINPLSIIQGNAKILKGILEASPPDLDKALANAEKILRNTTRIEKIVRGMRSLSRESDDEDPLTLEPLNRVIDAVLDISAGRFNERQTEFRYERPDDSVVIHCRSVQLGQAVLNLLNNAIDAVEGLAERWIELGVRLTPEQVIITVTDSGQGIPEPVRTKMLQPFFTTKAVGYGTGLGLSITHKIIASHEGDLRYDETCPNTRFVVTLPRPKAAAEVPPFAQAS